jgi:hypothetical protein
MHSRACFAAVPGVRELRLDCSLPSSANSFLLFCFAGESSLKTWDACGIGSGEGAI